MRSLVSGVLAVIATSGPARADGDALVDVLGPREIAVGEAMRGAATGASGIGLNPAGIPLNRELVFEGGYGYRGADHSSLIGISACDSTNAIPGCFFYDYAGSNPELDGMSLHRRTHVAGTALSYLITPRIAIGASGKYFHFDSDVMGESDASGFSWDVGATVRLTELVNVGVAGYNLWGTTASVQFPRAAGGGVLARPIPTLSLSFDMRWKLEGTEQGARYGGGAELFLRGSGGQSGYPIRLGALHDNGLGATYLSGGLGYASAKFGVDVAGRRGIDGASDTMLIASMRFWGPRQPAPGLE